MYIIFFDSVNSNKAHAYVHVDLHFYISILDLHLFVRLKDIK